LTSKTSDPEKGLAVIAKTAFVLMTLLLATILAFVPLQALCTDPSCIGVGSSCGGESVLLGEVEAQELNEAAALRMELLQSKTTKHGFVHDKEVHVASSHKHVAHADVDNTAHANVTSLAVVDATKASEAGKAETGLISLDHNGKVCMLCNKPLPERTDRNYTEFRTDCGGKSSATGPTKAVLGMAAVQLHETSKAGQTQSNGFCELNFAKSCVDAVANKDYLYWPKSINLNASASKSNSAWDGRYCKMNGFLEHDIISLQHDFEGLKKKGDSLCKAKYGKYNIEKLSFMDMMTAARYDDEAAPKLEEAELLAAWNCAMGDLGCDLALCAYSFCKKGTSTGLYDECEGWDPVRGMPFASSSSETASD